MIRVHGIWILILIAAFFITAGCSQKQQPAVPAKKPQVSLSCIGVMPVVFSVEYDTEDSFSHTKSLKDGVEILDKALHKKFQGRDDVRFINNAQLYGMDEAGAGDFLDISRKVGNYLSCNGVLEMTLWRYEDRVGGQYTAKKPASVSFTYRLVEVNSGVTLCQGRYDEVQKSVMENLYNFSSARKRGFTWVTAEELLREGLEKKLGECSYLQIEE